MKIGEIHKSHLRNDEHFQFHTAVCELIIREDAETLKIAPLFAAYQALHNKEDEGIKRIRKSFLTGKIREADKARDDTYAGMALAVESALHHHNAPAREAAGRLKILFDTYGNVSKKPLNEQTSALHNILQELKGAYLTDAMTIGISGWTLELEARNAAFEALMNRRFDEAASKTDVNVRTARLEVDAAYDKIVVRVNALAEVEGAATYETFIGTLNTIIAKYTAILHLRLGRKHHKPETDGNGENEGENQGGETDEAVSE